jgi:hypothetical protein
MPLSSERQLAPDVTPLTPGIYREENALEGHHEYRMVKKDGSTLGKLQIVADADDDEAVGAMLQLILDMKDTVRPLRIV